ncbi:31396_t:CDS:1, partial [Racocetra persica]
ESEFRDLVTTLRQYYKFKRLLSDYIINKKLLPAQPFQITTIRSFNFPIKDKTSALQFIAEIQNEFYIPEPLPPNYVDVNYTNKSNLSIDHTQIKEINLTILITSPKQLVDMARKLYTYYFFHQLLSEKIQINNNKETSSTNKGKKLLLLPNIKELQSQLAILDPDLQIQLPIKEYKNIKPTLN